MGTKFPRLLRVKEVAEVLSMHPKTVYVLVERGLIPGIRIGRNYRIPEPALRRLVERGVQGSHGEGGNHARLC